MAESVIPTSTLEIRKEDRARTLFDLHIAEYQAITMRNTYWITLQWAVYPILVVYIGAAIQLWKPETSLTSLFGSSAIMLQLLAIAWLHTVSEQFNNLLYLERYLRPEIARLVGTPEFWHYEPHLARSREQTTPKLEWKYGAATLSLAIVASFGVLTYYVLSAAAEVWAKVAPWLILNVVVVLVTTFKIKQVLHLQKQMAEFAVLDHHGLIEN